MRRWTLLAILSLCGTALAQEESGDPVAAEEAPEEEFVPERKDWLSAHQSPDGGWSAHGFRSQCIGEPCGGEGTWDSEVGSTGLALLAFLGFGVTHRTPRCGDVVRRASARLMEIQDADGCFGMRYPERFVADHAMATLAMAELAGMTGSPLFRPSVERGLAFLLSQRGADGGWRTGDRVLDSDAVATAWAVAALSSARGSGFPVDEEVFRGARAFLDGLTDPESGSVRLHRLDKEPDRRAVAAAVLARIFCHVRDEEDPAIARGGVLLLGALPAGEFAEDPEFWYFATQACFRIGGHTWSRWNESMKRSILDTQVMDKETCRWSSWDPSPGPTGDMGRIATTAFGVLCIQPYYRYARVFGSADPPKTEVVPAPPAARISNRAAALDLEFPEPRTGFVR
jgi:hypothetical protein